MRTVQLRALSLTAIAVMLCCASARGQAPLEPAQMPSRTSFYLLWRGTPTSGVAKTNSLLALWNDPDFAPIRSALFENAVSNSQKDASKQSLTRDELEEYSTLLENPFVLGYLRKPESQASSGAPAKSTEPPWNGLFFVYDRSGKEALLAKAVLRLRSQEKDPPQISQITVADIPVLKVERKSGVTYWAEHGKYAVSASERSVLEEILRRVGNNGSAASSLAQSSAYKEAQPLLGAGLLEFFVRIPGLKDLAPEAGPGGLKFAPALDALKLDAVHSLCGQIILEGSKTRVQAAILGDAAPGTLFDFWSDGQQSPASLAFLAAKPISYSETRFNLSAIYDLLKRAIRASLPPSQQAGTDMMEALAQVRLGMPISDALALVTGEFASLQTSPALETQNAAIFLGIRKKPEVLKLLQTLFKGQISTESGDGDVTFLKFSTGSAAPSSGSVGTTEYHLAVAPDFILAASNTETLHDLLAKRSATASDFSFAPKFQAARAQFPSNVNGISYFDFTKVDWPKLKEHWITEAKKAKPASAPTVPVWLTTANPEVFSRHLHFMAGASWKDPKGIHFDQWLE